MTFQAYVFSLSANDFLLCKKDSTKSALTLDATTHDASDLTARETTNVEGNTIRTCDFTSPQFFR